MQISFRWMWPICDDHWACNGRGEWQSWRKHRRNQNRLCSKTTKTGRYHQKGTVIAIFPPCNGDGQFLWKKNLHLQLIESKETLARNNQISKQQMNDMQMNIAFFTETNKTLDKDLQTASKTIVSQENSKTIRTNWKIDANTKFTISAILLTGWAWDEIESLRKTDCLWTSYIKVSMPLFTCI